MKQQKTVEHNIEGPGKPVLQEKQVSLFLNFSTEKPLFYIFRHTLKTPEVWWHKYMRRKTWVFCFVPTSSGKTKMCKKGAEKLSLANRIAFDYNTTSLSRISRTVTVSEQKLDQEYNKIEDSPMYEFELDGQDKMALGRNVELGEATSYVALDVVSGFDGHFWNVTVDFWPFWSSSNEAWDLKPEDAIFQIRV